MVQVTTFSESTASILTESLQEDREMTRGYIDDLRRLMTPKSKEVEASHSKPPTPCIPFYEGLGMVRPAYVHRSWVKPSSSPIVTSHEL